MADDVVADAGFVQLAPDVWITSPTRVHEVLLQYEAGRWVAWAAYYHRSHADGRTPLREWVLYKGPHVRRAVQEAVRFARRLAK